MQRTEKLIIISVLLYVSILVFIVEKSNLNAFVNREVPMMSCRTELLPIYSGDILPAKFKLKPTLSLLCGYLDSAETGNDNIDHSNNDVIPYESMNTSILVQRSHEDDSSIIRMEEKPTEDNKLQPKKRSIQDNDSVPDNSVPVKIVILTYMRSGSSFIGDILQHDPGVFYLFEPLRMIQHAVRANNPILYQNGTWSPGDNFLRIGASTAEAWLACKPENLGLAVWEDGFLTSKSNKAKVFSQCFEKVKHTLPIKSSRAHCIEKLKEVCLSSKTIVTKIIRMPMYYFNSLMSKYSNMKIIHLIRDPRSTLASQRIFGNFNDNELPMYSSRFCNRVLRDMFEAEHLQQKYPGRIMRIFYEDLADRPIAISKKLYKFTDLDYTADTQSYILNITKGSVSKCDRELGKGMCTIRSNSSAQAREWRDKVSLKFVQEVDISCRALLYELRLKEIKTFKQMQDKHYKLALGPKGFDDFRWS